MEEKKIQLDDLPLYSPWPARIIGIENWQTRVKTPQEITREYEYEKWGPLLQKAKNYSGTLTLEKIDEWVLHEENPSVSHINDKLIRISILESHKYYVNLIEKMITPYLPSSALVELGAGYGTIILALAKMKSFYGMKVMAGEYTPSGIELLKIIGTSENLSIKTGRCDFNQFPITDLNIPKNAIIFTSFATPYVRELKDSFIESLLSYEPKIVIHFEPCYEHCDEKKLIGLMRKKYIEINDYNRNLVTILKKYQANKKLKIIQEDPMVYGDNPYLLASQIVWEAR
jgi:hypothetical protein